MLSDERLAEIEGLYDDHPAVAELLDEVKRLREEFESFRKGSAENGYEWNRLLNEAEKENDVLRLDLEEARRTIRVLHGSRV